MAFIIDKTYFEGGELNIPGTETTAVSEKITDFITKYEPEYLLRALGYPLYKLLKADAYPNPVTPRFVALMSGGDAVEYTDSRGHVHTWSGLDSTIKSPIAMYVWYWYSRQNATYSSPSGEVKGTAENSVNVSAATKQMRAYNEMSNITCQLWDFLRYYEIGGVIAFPEFELQHVNPFGVLNTMNI